MIQLCLLQNANLHTWVFSFSNIIDLYLEELCKKFHVHQVPLLTPSPGECRSICKGKQVQPKVHTLWGGEVTGKALSLTAELRRDVWKSIIMETYITSLVVVGCKTVLFSKESLYHMVCICIKSFLGTEKVVASCFLLSEEEKVDLMEGYPDILKRI